VPKFPRQPDVGRCLRELRERAGASRAEVARATGVNPSALARLERGDDVRLSTYLPVVDYFLDSSPQTWMAAQRFVGLPEQLRELVAWFGQAGADEER
jgi:transcriptional regulator with XRE-family HTH domain